MYKNRIDYWFPTPIYVLDELLLHQLDKFELHIKDIISTTGSYKNSLISVESTWETNNQLHLEPTFSDLVDEIYAHTRYFLSQLGYDETTINNIKINNMWANISHKDDHVFPHIHGNTFIGGAFYVKKIDGCKIKFFGDLKNTLPRPAYFNSTNVEYCEYDCDPGRLILFKSNTLHGTTRQPDGEKIVIAFNIGVTY